MSKAVLRNFLAVPLLGTLGLGGTPTYMLDTMNEIVNLKRVRKGKARAEAEASAAANRAAHGRSKAEKQSSKAKAETASRQLDAHKRDKDG